MGSQDQNAATETYFNTEINAERVQTKECPKFLLS